MKLVMTLLVRTTPVDQLKKKTDGLSVLLIDIRQSLGQGLMIRPIDTMVNHHTNEVFYENLRVPVENLIGRADRVMFSSAGRSLPMFWTWRSDRFFKAVE